jgi:hypothetical protein
MASAIALPALCDGADNFAPVYSDSSFSLQLPQRIATFGPIGEDITFGGSETKAFRPFVVTNIDSTTGLGWQCCLYPLYNRRDYPGGYRWNVLELWVGAHSISAQDQPVKDTQLWPLYWNYDTGRKEDSYTAVFPIWGTLRNHLFCKQIDWKFFPAYLKLSQGDYADTYYLFIFRSRTGDGGVHGGAVWPFFGHYVKPGKYDNTYMPWPLVYDNISTQPERLGGGSMEKFGFLPIYASETAPGLESQTYLWPFFGYTNEWAPRKNYHEVRYLYPLVVRARGEYKNADRYLPFYTYETTPDHRKTWYMWPIFKQDDARVENLDVHKDQVLYFLYKNEIQTAPGHDFKARKTQVWPLFGYIDDGAGKKQFLMLNPFEPLFGGNEMLRQTWTPLFAFYRSEQNGAVLRRSVLWNTFLFERDGRKTDFSVSLFFQRKRAPESSGWSVARGLLKCETRDGVSHVSALWGLFGGNKGK